MPPTPTTPAAPAAPAAPVGAAGIAQGIAGSLESTEKLAGASVLVDQLTSSIGRMFQSPLTSQYAWHQIGNALDTYLIKKLRESKDLTDKQREAFDQMARTVTASTNVLMRYGGAAAGVTLKIALMTEELEIAAVKAQRFSGFGSMPGGGAPFEEASKRQLQGLEMMSKYGETFSKGFVKTRDEIEKTLQQLGIGSRETRTKIVENVEAMSQLTQTDIGQWAEDIHENFASLHLDFETAVTLSKELYTAWQANALAGSTFDKALSGIMETVQELGPALGYDKALATAISLSQLTKQGFGRGEIAKMSHVLLRGGMEHLSEGAYATLQKYAPGDAGGMSYKTYVAKMQAKSGPEQIATYQRIAKLLGSATTDITANVEKKALVTEMFGDAETWRRLTASTVIATDKLKDLGITLEGVHNSAKILETDKFLSDAAKKNLEDASTLSEKVKALTGSLTTNMAKGNSKDLTYLLSMAIPLTLMLNKGTSLYGKLAVAQQLQLQGGGGDGKDAGRGGLVNSAGQLLSSIVMMEAIGGKGGKKFGSAANEMIEVGAKSTGGLIGKFAQLGLVAEAFGFGWTIGKGIAGMLKDADDKRRAEHPGTPGERAMVGAIPAGSVAVTRATRKVMVSGGIMVDIPIEDKVVDSEMGQPVGGGTPFTASNESRRPDVNSVVNVQVAVKLTDVNGVVQQVAHKTEQQHIARGTGRAQVATSRY